MTGSHWPSGDGAMAAAIRAHDWAATPLGPLERWPQSLKTVVDLMLATAQPVRIGWGPDLVSLCNDAWIPIAGATHPDALGRPFLEMGVEARDDLATDIAAVTAGEPRTVIGRPKALAGRPTSRFSFACTPLRDESGAVGGLYCVAAEIPARMPAERALRESEAMRRIALSGGRMGSWRWDRAADVIQGDAQFMSLWGMPATDAPLPLATFAARMSRNGAAEMADVVARAVIAGEEFAGPLEIVSGPTAGRWVEWRGRAAADDPAVLHGVTFDITEQRAVETQLRESEERLRDVLHSIGEGFALFGPDFTILDVNDETLRLDGRTRAELVGRSHWEAFPGSRDSALGEMYRRTMRDRRAGELQHRYAWPDGREAWVDVRAYPTPDGGVACFWRDITADKSAEAALRDSEERLAFLLKLSDALRALTDGAEVERRAIGLLGEYLRADRCFLSPVYDDGSGMCVREEYLRADASSVLGEYTFAQFGDFVGPTLHAGHVLAVEDVAALPHLAPAERASYAAVEIGAYLLVPLIRDGRLAAFLTVNHRTARAWSDADQAIARQTADRLWAARERARAEAALRDSEERLAFLLKLSDALRAQTEPAAMERSAMALLGRRLGVSRAFFATIDEEAGTWSTQHVQADRPPAVAVRHPLSDFQRSRLAQWAAGQTTSVADSETDPRLTAADRADYAVAGARAAVGVPMVSGGRLAALLVLNQIEPREWTDAELSLARATGERTWAEIERARTEQVLRDRETELALTQAIGQIASVDVALTDPPTGVRSPEYRRLHGLSPDQVVETHGEWLARLHPDDRAEQDRLFWAAIETGAPYESEYRIVRPSDGEERWIGAKTVIERDAAGAATRLRGAHTDITARKRADAALRESEARFSQFGEASSDVLWMVDAATGKLDYLSPAFERMWGTAREPVMADLARWAEMLHPEDRERALSVMPRAMAGETIVQEYRIIRGDGAVRYITDVGFPIFDAQGRVMRVGGIAQDLTERRQAEAAARESEERQRLMVELVPVLLWSASPDGQEVALNERWLAYTGQSEAETQHYGWLDAIHPDDLPGARAAFERAFATGEPLERQQRVRHAGDGWRWHLVRQVPMRDESGRILRWFGAAIDIDELHQLQGRQQVLVAELQHRVRNILTVVRSVFGRTVEAGGAIEDIADHFTGRLDALARTQVVVTQSATGDVDLEDLIRDELLSVGATGGADVTIEGPDVRLSAKAAESIGLAIHELTTNAIKYGALRVAGGKLRIEWSDNIVYGDGRRLVLSWTERGVPALPLKPARRGFGSELIEEALPYRLGAETKLEFTGGGVSCTIAMPLPEPRDQ